LGSFGVGDHQDRRKSYVETLGLTTRFRQEPELRLAWGALQPECCQPGGVSPGPAGPYSWRAVSVTEDGLCATEILRCPRCRTPFPRSRGVHAPRYHGAQIQVWPAWANVLTHERLTRLFISEVSGKSRGGRSRDTVREYNTGAAITEQKPGTAPAEVIDPYCFEITARQGPANLRHRSGTGLHSCSGGR
jgi:hypothetical protein